MVKNAISDYSSTAASNTDVGGVNVDEGMPPSSINNAIREIMSHLADLNAGSSSLGTIKVDNLQLDGNAITSTDTDGDITITPNGNGNVVIDGLNYPQVDGTANYFLKTNGAGQLSFAQVGTASIVDDAITAAKINDNEVGAAALNVSGNGTAGQFLASDGDGSMTWTDAGGGFTPTTASGTSQSLDLGSYNFFNGGTHTGNTTLSFSNVPTEANWRYTFKAGGDAYRLDTFLYDQFYHTHEIATSQGTSLYHKDLKFKSDGTKMYVVDVYDAYVWQYSLSTAWDVSTATYDSVKYTSLGAGYISGIDFKTDGTVMFAFAGGGSGNRLMYSIPLSTAWDISTAGSASSSALGITQASAGNYWALHFKPDGTKFFLSADSGNGGQNYVFGYTLSTAWDITSTVTYSDNYVVDGLEVLRGFTFNDDGTKLFTIDNGHDYIQEHTLSTAYNTSTASYNISHNVQSELFVSFGAALAFGDSGTKFYFGSRGASSAINQFRVGSPYTLTLPSSVQNKLAPRDKYVPDDIVTYEFYTTDGGTNVYIINDNVT